MNMAETLRFQKLRGELRRDEPMARHVSWRTGGRADRFYVPADLDDLGAFLRQLPDDEPLLFVGLGSNLLVRDGGLRGTVILMHARLAPAGAARRQDLRRSRRRQPESGALRRHARSRGRRVPRRRAGHGRRRAGDERRLLRRRDLGRGRPRRHHQPRAARWWCARATSTTSATATARRRRRARNGSPRAWFRLKPGDGATSRAVMKELLARRIATQPLSLPNAGSVFRNPPKHHAAHLIETCGLKGFERGGARVSEKHANFIVNPKGAAQRGGHRVADPPHPAHRLPDEGRLPRHRSAHRGRGSYELRQSCRAAWAASPPSARSR